ncbi:5'-nucleotidase [Citrobacter koseri]|uniref:5'-nucleotidase n=1 Tax=Citrobacter koseri TaxID=545 RepID=A0A2X2VT93_CITKO|nr:5'-nucleotidase [Citrobacter koseri]
MKYFNSQIAQEYKAIEKIAQQKLVDMVPDELRDIFRTADRRTCFTAKKRKSVVKQADALCAYLKCLEELSAGNNEFLLGKNATGKNPGVAPQRRDGLFLWRCLCPVFHLSLDEISQDSPL